VRHTLGTRKVSMARREVATELTGMAFGGITASACRPACASWWTRP
jgi:prolyl-tRNA editing enzyme YbaK/EbsC (Cys-tRNA(Pro) deacylase)